MPGTPPMPGMPPMPGILCKPGIPPIPGIPPMTGIVCKPIIPAMPGNPAILGMPGMPPIAPRLLIPGIPGKPIIPPRAGIPGNPIGPPSPIPAIGFIPSPAIIPAIELEKRLLAWAAAAAADVPEDVPPHEARLTPDEPAAADEAGAAAFLLMSMLLRFCLLNSAGPAAAFEGTLGAAMPPGRSEAGAGMNEADIGTSGLRGIVELAERQRCPGLELRLAMKDAEGPSCGRCPPADCDACMSNAKERGCG